MFLLKLHHVQRCVKGQGGFLAELMNHLTRGPEKPLKDGYMIYTYFVMSS